MFNIDINQVFTTLNSSYKGLSKSEAEKRLFSSGFNKLDEPKKKNWIQRFLNQFKDVLIIALLCAAVLSVLISVIEKTYDELIDAGIIMFVLLVNAFIGLLQENKADKAMEALKKMTKPYAKILRDERIVKVKTEELVVGDIVLLEAGDIVPADLRLFEVASLKIEESSITGESVASEKSIEKIDKNDVPLGDQHNMAFMGTVVTYGRGKGIIVATGMQTQMGHIANILSTTQDDVSPLTKRINKTAKIITIIIGFVAVFVLIMEVLRGHEISHAFMIAIAIAVSAIPEGLPASVSITLSIGAKSLSESRAIIKHLSAVETLGSTQVICSDKTGTLTLNKMTVQQLYVYNIPNYVKSIELSSSLPVQNYEELAVNASTQQLINCMLLCNDTELKYENEILSTVGDPTETALVHYGFLNHIYKDKLDGAFPRINEIPFDSKRKMMTVMVDDNHTIRTYTKGAIDSILPHCKYILNSGIVQDLTPDDINEIYKVNKIYANNALRILAFATKIETADTKCELQTAENDMIFIGLVGMIDPPREEVFEAIKTCKTAGITPIMITGDHKDTAFAIAKQLGIAALPTQVITGVELDNISDEDLVVQVNKYRVYARVNPEHKVRIVQAFKAQGKVVAMTGDGVNDAPSLKAADIGVGMGITGTDVTKGVADMILTDDNFATIVGAVKEGRKIYSNILKIIVFMLTTGVAEVILMVTIIAILNQDFFTPALILYINFVSDTLVSLALGDEKAEPHIMKQKPISDKRNILFTKTGFNIIYMSIVQSLIVLSLYFLSKYVWGFDHDVVVTMSFITLVCMELFHSYNLRSETESLFTLGLFSNRYLNISFLISFFLTTIIVLFPISSLHSILGIVALNVEQWAIAIGFAFAIIPIVELVKLGMRLFDKQKKKKNTATQE